MRAIPAGKTAVNVFAASRPVFAAGPWGCEASAGAVRGGREAMVGLAVNRIRRPAMPIALACALLRHACRGAGAASGTESMTEALYDVAVIGAGVAGIATAARLAHDGRSVLLVASHRRHPREFRAEKFGAAEADLLARLGLWEPARGAMTELDTVSLGAWGRSTGRIALREYATRYPDLVDALRAGLPGRVAQAVGRVAQVEAGADTQAIVLADGRRERARLVVLATGLLDGVRRQLGIGRTVVSPAHALIYGFDLSPRAATPFQSLTWRGERLGDGISYLTLFPLGDVLRGNLFTHWDPAGREAHAFARDPAGALASRFPGLIRCYGSLVPAGPVDARTVDLTLTPTPMRDGVVLVGDAFCTSCPSTGTGIRKVLTDVDRLVAHVPDWLASPGMPAGKIARFYADALKRACDHDALTQSLTTRRMLVDTSPAWRFRRFRSLVYRRSRHELAALRLRSGLLATRLRPGL